MKNLKKVLSMVLAMAMASSLMATAFAKDASGYTDYSKITEVEAVDVMTALGIFNGTSDGSFDPTTVLTREQAAKIVTYLILGEEAAEKLTTTTTSYKDVAANRWSAPAIQYCTSQGILAGSAGKFDPTGKLTGQAFAKMMLVVLGYDAKIEGMVGTPAWGLNVAKLAFSAGLDDGIKSLSAPMTREQAARMAFNALTATMVAYKGGASINTPDGTSVMVGAERYEVENKSGKGYLAADNDDLMQYCEKKFEDLKLTEKVARGDAFGRPANEWTLDKESIGTYGEEADFTYTAEVDKKDMAKDLRGYSLKNLTKENVVINGKAEGTTGASAISSSDALAGKTGNGITVEVFVDKKEVTNVVISADVLAQITKIDKKNSTVTLKKVAGPDDVTTIKKVEDDNTCYKTLEAMEKDDYVLVTVADGEVQTATTVKTVKGTVSKVKKDESVTLDGTVYEFAKNDKEGHKLAVDKDKQQELYLDSHGYVLYAEGVAETDTVDTIYVTKQYTGNGDWGTTNMIQGVLADGTVVTGEYTGKTTPVAGQAYQYTKNGKKYELNDQAGSMEKMGVKVATTAGKTIHVDKKDKKLVYTQDGTPVWNNYFASDVKFVHVTGEADKVKVTVKEGVHDVTLTDKDYVVIAKDSNGNMVVSAVYVAKNAVTKSDDIIYVADAMTATNYTGTGYGKDDETSIYTYEVYLNGEKTEVPFESKQTQNVGFYTYSVDDKTGAYELSDKPNNVIDRDTVKSVDQIGSAYYISLNTHDSKINGYDATNAVVVDVKNGDDGINSLDELKESKDKNVAVVYDGDKETVTTIYVLN